jgi:serine beta-lactamase-like protein LACTB, mitochondrial
MSGSLDESTLHHKVNCMGALRIALIVGSAGVLGGAVAGVAWRDFTRRLQAPDVGAIEAVPHCAQSVNDPRFARAIAAARPQLLAMMRERRIPGLSVTVAVDGRIAWSEGFGFADAERRRPACPDTRFRLASVSKPITATIMAKLADEGRLGLDQPAQRYVPTFPSAPVTLRQLAAHRSGIRPYRDDAEAFTQVQYGSLRESLVLFQGDTLLFTPGTSHEYTGYGYMLLGAALEAASGEEFGALVERVLRPIGMLNTTVDRNDSTMAGLTRFYDHATPYVADGQVHASPFVAMSSKWPSGGILSTTEDLARFGSALLPRAPMPLLTDSTRESLFTTHSWLAPPVAGYALGWITMRDVDLRKVYMHFGAGSGATSWLGIFPDERVVVAVLSNLGHARLTYATTIGLAKPFMQPRMGGVAAAFALGLVVFTAATAVILGIVRLARRP